MRENEHRKILDALLAGAAPACGLARGRANAMALQQLCGSAGDAIESAEREDAAARIARLSAEELEEVLRFVAARFHLLNQAEQVNIVRVNRERARAASPERPRPESLMDAMLRLRSKGLDGAGVRALIERLDVQPTLTAHPTEAKRRSVLDNLVRIAELLIAQQVEESSGDARERMDRMSGLVQILLSTDDVRSKRLDVIDEVKNGLFFLCSSIWGVAPRLMRELCAAGNEMFGAGTLEQTDLPALLRYRTWIGGDRDGNPKVTHEITRATMRLLRSAVADLWERELRDLQQELSLSTRRLPIPEWFVELTTRDGDTYIEDPTSLEQRQHEPIRIRLMQIRGKIRRDPRYDGAALVQDLLRIRDAIQQAGLVDVARKGRLADAIVRARVFGLHLATLDIRQHSAVHEVAVGELLGLAGVARTYGRLTEAERVAVLRAELTQPRPLCPVDAPLSVGTRELMQTLGVVRQAVEHDRRSVRSYIISMTHGVSDVLEALLLMKEAGLARVVQDADGHARLVGMLHVVPLLETIDDLAHGETLVGSMLDDPMYRSHLESLVPSGVHERPSQSGPVQEIMLGYSDSNKDGGFLMANLALDRAQRRIAHAVRSRGVLLRFFHGRGGTIGRGGGRAGRAILATPGPARTGRVRFTEQGEVISFRYALPAIAHRHLEQIMHASLVASADEREQERAPQLVELLDRMSKRSMQRYRELIDDAEFWQWFLDAGPIGSIAGLPIASRPVMRAVGGGTAVGEGAGSKTGFDQLRAIPWVFTWVQMRCLVPGWFGLGTAMEAITESERELLAQEYGRSDWLSTVIDNAAQELLRARLVIGRRYALAGRTPVGARLVETLSREHALACQGVLRITGRSVLDADAPIVAQSIRDRNPWTDVLNLVQIELLERARRGDEAERRRMEPLLQQSVSAIAAAMQSTG